jgi:superfamily II DNA or RNA helicase
MPRGIYSNLKCTGEDHPPFEPTKHQRDTVDYFLKSPFKGLLLYHKLGCLDPDTPVLLYDGTVKKAEEITVKDKLIGDDGLPRTVLETVSGVDKMYRIEQNKGDSYTVNSEHILSLHFSGNMNICWVEKTKTWSLMWLDKKLLKIRYKTVMCNTISKEEGYKIITDYRDKIYEDNIIDIKVSDYLSLSKSVKARLKCYKCPKIHWEHKDVSLDPYILGLWLGDGNSRGDGFTTADTEIYDSFVDWANNNNSIIKNGTNQYTYYIRSKIPRYSTFMEQLRKYNLVNCKHIPKDYLINDENVRLNILAGLVDTDGYIDSNCIEISQKNKELAEQICYMARSLGFQTTLKNREKSCTYKGEKRTGIYCIIYITGSGIEKIPTRVARKKLSPRRQIKNALTTSFNVVPLGDGKYCGWKLDGNKRFLLGDFTVTHNSGKTCSSILIADTMLRKNKVKHVYIMSPGSLREGWVNEYCRVCGADPVLLRTKYTFITYNYMVGDNLPDFKDSLVIIDEVHNLINGAKNMSKHPTAVYDALLKSNCRVLALSGTPIYNYVYEFSLLGNLLKPGGEFPDIRRGDQLDPYAFMTFFDIQPDGSLVPKNKTKMKRKLDGIISYYPGAGEEFVPQVEEMPIIKVQMATDQEFNYWDRAIQEQKLDKPPSESLKRKDPKRYELLQRLYVMARKNILTRSASNFYYPEEIKDVVDFTVENKGWISKKSFQNGELYKKYSTKISAFLLNIVMHDKQKHVLFTFFKEKSGVYLIKSILGLCGIKSEIFSGDLDDGQRRQLLKRFNSKENRYGDKIRVLLVTEAGAEGISVLEARHMHILESSPRMSKTIQAIGRVARFKSHIALPPEERKIKVWKYWSIASPDEVTITTTFLTPEGEQEQATQTIEDKKTIDEILYDKGMKTIRGIDSFLDLIKLVSVTPFEEELKK